MKFIGLYNTELKLYVDNIISELVNAGYSAESINYLDYHDYTELQLPVFLVEKESKAGYFLVGKHTVETVIEWAINSQIQE